MVVASRGYLEPWSDPKASYVPGCLWFHCSLITSFCAFVAIFHRCIQGVPIKNDPYVCHLYFQNGWLQK